MDSKAQQMAQSLGEHLIAQNLRLVTAESCTGGWIAKIITDQIGSSRWYEHGFVTYSDQSKQKSLQVPEHILQQYGAVSEATVQAMVCGASSDTNAHFSLAVTGIAGPGGSTPDKPVGMVCFGWYRVGDTVPISETVFFKGSREQIRIQAVEHALSGALSILKTTKPLS